MKVMIALSSQTLVTSLKLQENLKKTEKLVAEREKLQKALESAKEDHSQISEQNQVCDYWNTLESLI